MTTHHGAVPETDSSESHSRRKVNPVKIAITALGAIATFIGVILFLQYSTLNITAPTGESAIPPLERLVTQNYKVEAVGHAVNRDFIGGTLAISAGGRVHTCSGLLEDKLKAKEPITCKDGYVVQPKP